MAKAASDSDLDMLTRTMLGEAYGQPDEGLSAVAHTVLNRQQAGSYGKTIPDIVLAKHQFEPWATRSRELMAIDPKSAAYQRAYRIAQDAVSGASQDPTGGATHFLDPAVVMHRYGKLPKWAQGEPLATIGDPRSPHGYHAFYSPDRKLASAEPSAVIHGAVRNPAAVTPPDDAAAFEKEFMGGGHYPAGSMTPDHETSAFEREFMGDATPAAQSAQNAPAASPAPLEGNWWERAKAASDQVPYLNTAGQHWLGSAGLTESGIADLMAGPTHWLPNPHSSINPLDWSGGGILKTLAGGLGMFPTSPLISAAIEKYVGAPVTGATGDPRLGAGASILASLAAPGPKIPFRPRAAQLLTRDIGGVGAPEILSAGNTLRASAHPHLSLMDVDPRARDLAISLVQSPQTSKAGTHLINVARKRANASESFAGRFGEDQTNVDRMTLELLKSRPPARATVRVPGDVMNPGWTSAALAGELALQTGGPVAAGAVIGRAVGSGAFQRMRQHTDQQTALEMAKLISEPGGSRAISAAQRAMLPWAPPPMPQMTQWPLASGANTLDRLLSPAAAEAVHQAGPQSPLRIRSHGEEAWR